MSTSSYHPANSDQLTISRAEIVLLPRTKWEWAKQQLLTINWTNVALIVTVLAISARMNATAHQQQTQLDAANDSLTQMQSAIRAAQFTILQLNSSQQQLSDYQLALSNAESLGLSNLTTIAKQLTNLNFVQTCNISTGPRINTEGRPDVTITYDAGQNRCQWLQIGAQVIYTFTVTGTLSGSGAGLPAMISLPVPPTSIYSYGALATAVIAGAAHPDLMLNTANSGTPQPWIYVMPTNQPPGTGAAQPITDGAFTFAASFSYFAALPTLPTCTCTP